jgi:hypothetical protein
MVLATRLTGTEFAGGFAHGQYGSFGIQPDSGDPGLFVFFLWFVIHLPASNIYLLSKLDKIKTCRISPPLAGEDAPASPPGSHGVRGALLIPACHARHRPVFWRALGEGDLDGLKSILFTLTPTRPKTGKPAFGT